LYEFCAHLRTSDSRTGFLSVSSDREGDGRRDGKHEMTGIHGNAPLNR
jgi:hypothetical protein